MRNTLTTSKSSHLLNSDKTKMIPIKTIRDSLIIREFYVKASYRKLCKFINRSEDEFLVKYLFSCKASFYSVGPYQSDRKVIKFLRETTFLLNLLDSTQSDDSETKYYSHKKLLKLCYKKYHGFNIKSADRLQYENIKSMIDKWKNEPEIVRAYTSLIATRYSVKSN